MPMEEFLTALTPQHHNPHIICPAIKFSVKLCGAPLQNQGVSLFKTKEPGADPPNPAFKIIPFPFIPLKRYLLPSSA